jgi:hypothetical protein
MIMTKHVRRFPSAFLAILLVQGEAILGGVTFA